MNPAYRLAPPRYQCALLGCPAQHVSKWQICGTPEPLTLCDVKPDVFTVSGNTSSKPIVRIAADGRIFWLDREVETDEDFRRVVLAMLGKS